MAKKGAADTGTIELTRLKDSVVEIPIKGLTDVIIHAWSEKAKRMMPGHPERDTVKKSKSVRDPKEEAEACLYKLGEDRLGFPATGFKAAIVGACRFFDKPSMVEAKQLIFVEGEGSKQLVPFIGKRDTLKMEIHEDLPRLPNGSSDLRYRYYISDWRMLLRVRYVPDRITKESVIALVDAAGRGGIGDWRPSAPKSMTGSFGTWRVDETAEIKEIAS